MKYKLSELLDDDQLSDKQYMLARDAGWTPEELEGKGSAWFSAHASEIKYEGANLPALPKQIAYLESLEIEVDINTYSKCRKLIRKIGIRKDERYKLMVEKQEAHNRSRSERRSGEPTETEVPEVIIDESVREPSWNHRGEELLREAMKHGRIVKQ